ncbi:2-hydroxymuconic semialdehyde dehydrogenase [Paraburkholderia caballeronis]|uniref:2-hydroxymuconate semialdehyde dehydrogenase n=1 Tax=Paraburkholderia caballeronis TaxID=416943 RepID=A0A1H7SZL2_9BURK|nr:2-hydroxymuconic semialdehyde dehydrogenase [Paraburkholderia caballeronis]PXW25763.1 2-hydroxymuconate semialdehyde dehydrogenase [Paraburkholderia caballeronis]PXX01370.1 2-hydroxymuconate semialdehyde dehydrogenase [Paraburkholderia caballeronis]RAJ99276.1 2-hydroxymuconate semialdehyde dehydrogenase [Paraburkholderia caballeronis]SEE23474.1 2-hydroxymuconate semialdehyde dehydrogenase [Paraburkholderia caballeronis]SEL78092.1 2-hydroxymuconate semialdehyde dehydrogenase [Paraburkholderi
MAIETLNFIGGEFVPAASGRLFDNRSPVDNSLISRVHEAGQAEVDAAVAAARAALHGPWGSMSVQNRADMLYAVAEEINLRFDDFLQAEVADTGKPRSLASHLDIPRGAANFKVFADTVKSAGAEFFEMSTPDGGTALNYVLRRPKGVIAVVCPWNLPLLLMTWKVAPAIACGNTVVVKPSEETPSTATLLGEVMNKVGVPAGVYNVVHGFGPDSAGEFLTKHAGVNAITFTGETGTGAKILETAASGIKATSMELGGKNPSIVFADCDLENALEVTSRAVFANCGQVCLGTERVYVERPLFDEFVQRFGEIARTTKPGHPDDANGKMGPLISLGHREKVLSYYTRAKEEGAMIVAGGGIPVMPAELAEGAWIEPTVWTGLPESSAVVREEIFGPCCHIAPFDTEEEVVALANDTRYGLAAAVHTRNLQRAHRIAAQLEVGTCWINAWFLRDLRTPFGGAKMSGIGREGGLHSLEFYTELRNVCVKL